MSDVGAVEVTVTLEPRDIHRANFSMALAAAKSWYTVIIAGFLVASLFRGILLTYTTPHNFLWVALIALLFGALLWIVLTPAIFLLSYGVMYLASRSFVRKNSHALGPVTYQFSEAGCSSSAPNGRGDAGWASFSRIQETRDHFLLFYLQKGSNVIPKRCFAGQSDIEGLKALFRANYKGDLRLRKKSSQ